MRIKLHGVYRCPSLLAHNHNLTTVKDSVEIDCCGFTPEISAEQPKLHAEVRKQRERASVGRELLKHHRERS